MGVKSGEQPNDTPLSNETEADFDDEFNRIVAEVDAGPKDEPKDEPKEPVEEPPAPAAKEEPPAPPPPAPAAKEEPPAPPPPAPPAKEEPPAPPPPAPPAKEEPPAPPPEPLSDVEKARLAELEGEWADISEMLSLRDKVVKAKLEQEIADRLGKTVQELREGLAPIVQDHVSSRIEAHRAAILAAHPDSETVSPEVKKWIATQPAYLKVAMEQVYDAGSAQDVIDLFSRFKKETGRAAPQEPHPTPGGKQTEPAPNAARDDSAAALEHVRSRRVTPAPEGRGGPAKDDYDAAWEEAMAS